MAIAPRLELRQSQNLVMTPQLQQAIKLLQLNNIELTAFVEQELERNPLLESRESDDRPDQPEPESAPDSGDDGFGDEAISEMSITAENGGGAEAEQAIDTDRESISGEDSAADRMGETSGTAGDSGDFGGSLGQVGSGGSSRFDDMDLSLENTLGEEIGMRESLMNQLGLAVVDDVQRMVGAAIIDCIDTDGYFREDIDELAERLGCESSVVEDVLQVVQGFEPTGIAARNLSECLALQLIEQDRYDPAMARLVARLELLGRQDYPALMRECEVDEEDLAEMVSEIRRLDPRPGSNFEHDDTQTAVPDVLLRQKPDGGWAIELNSETLPRVLVNNRYYAEVSGATKKAEDKTYLSECLNTANWLVKSLDQRANTIMKVATELVRQQDGFFALGVQYLRPLNLKTIADAIGMHESTVSRVTANKYIGTPRGIFEMKYFFTAAIPSNRGGDSHSAESVRMRIRDLIAEEDPKKILSDDRIVEILKEEGIDIARRTVAKYREALRIPSSVQRRRQKRLQMSMAR